MASTGTVVRFDRRRGYGFVQPDDGGEDVFAHQNNINMEGFRFLQVGERVTYELEVGEKGMKAVSVALLEPRTVRPGGREDEYGSFDERDQQDSRPDSRADSRDDRDAGFAAPQPRERESRPPRAAAAPRHENNDQGDKAGRKLERLISLLVEKGVLAPGEIDGLGQSSAAAAPSA